MRSESSSNKHHSEGSKAPNFDAHSLNDSHITQMVLEAHWRMLGDPRLCKCRRVFECSWKLIEVRCRNVLFSSSVYNMSNATLLD